MALEPDPLRRRQSDTLPSMYSDFERTAREGEQFHRRNPPIARHSISTASPVSPTTTMYPGPAASFPPKYPPKTDSYATPPDSRKNSEDEKGPNQGRLSLPSLHEVGLTSHPPAPLHPPVGPQYPHHPSHPQHPLPPAHTLPPSHPPPPTHQGSQPHPPPPSVTHGPSHHHIPPHPQHPHSYTPSQPPNLPPAVHQEQQSYRYHEQRGFSESHPQSHPGPPPQQPSHDPYRQQQSYPPPPPTSARYSPHPPNGQNSFNYTPTAAQAQYQYPPHPPTPSDPPSSTTLSPYSQSMPPPYAPPYGSEQSSTHPPAYSASSPGSKTLGKRPVTTYGSAIDKALQMSSVRRDLEVVRNNSKYIYNLVQPFYETAEGSGYEHQNLEQVLAGFQKAIQDAEALKEGLENCRRTLAEMSKEHERIQQKGRSIPEYEVDDHVYGDDVRSVGSMQPELKRPRRGRAAPPGRCHSCHRAETPEWRRGPDGARTLCNACGLHYAKLTRKMSKNNLAPGAMTRKPHD